MYSISHSYVIVKGLSTHIFQNAIFLDLVSAKIKANEENFKENNRNQYRVITLDELIRQKQKESYENGYAFARETSMG